MEDLQAIAARVRAARADLDEALRLQEQAVNALRAADRVVSDAHESLANARRALYDAVEGAPLSALVLSPR